MSGKPVGGGREILFEFVQLGAQVRVAAIDAESGTAILDIFADFHRVGVTVVVATHDQSWIDRYHPNVLRLDHGRVAA